MNKYGMPSSEDYQLVQVELYNSKFLSIQFITCKHRCKITSWKYGNTTDPVSQVAALGVQEIKVTHYASDLHKDKVSLARQHAHLHDYRVIILLLYLHNTHY